MSFTTGAWRASSRAGSPIGSIAASRRSWSSWRASGSCAAELPRVIRPDLVLTEEGFTIAETDSVPGGIGLTGWLNEVYTGLGFEVIGGRDGMVEGFRANARQRRGHPRLARGRHLPPGDGVARASGAKAALRVHDAETYDAARRAAARCIAFSSCSICRISRRRPALMEAVREGRTRVTPPFKPYLEEKMWFALFWLRPLREFWRRELSERHFLALQKVIPFTWLLHPEPLPPHAVIPGLEVNSWDEVAAFSQKQRELILKISGFSELAWGSRSVALGSDLSHGDWQEAIRHALREFERHPYILQRFHKGRLDRAAVLRSDDRRAAHDEAGACGFAHITLSWKAKRNCAARSPRSVPRIRSSCTA